MKIFSALKSMLSALLLFSTVSTINAQSLPNVQKESVRAPSNIKIDGKASEWDNKLKAHNNATDLYYTLSNDDENLYLVIEAKYAEVMSRTLRGGITFTINHTLKKKDDTPVSITYPVFKTLNDMNTVTNLLGRKTLKLSDNQGNPIPMEYNVDDLNLSLSARSKYISVNGIKDIPDESISVYNEDGIKAVSQFEKPVTYVYELAIPLKYLALPNGGADGFAYHIKINEPIQFATPKMEGGARPVPPLPVMITSLAPTDFWGEYTLAKK